MHVHTVVLLCASTHPKVMQVASDIDTILRKQGIKVLHLYGEYTMIHDPHLPEDNIDLAFAIGGDGTVLKAARICAQRKIPILPIKVGHFGFISDIQYDEWLEALELCKKDILPYRDHALLCVCVDNQCWYALNDVTLQSVVYGTIQVQVHCNNEFLTRYRSDGIIISTAIGSTAHSLSVGGPIIVPDMNVFMINPIAPFTLSHRPLIMPIEYSISITLENQQRAEACLLADGRIVMGMLAESSCTIQYAGMSARIFRSPKRSYFEVLRNKLKWAGTL